VLFYSILGFFDASCQLFGGQLATDNYYKIYTKSDEESLLKAILKNMG
jgi:hypothetical protein